MAEKALFPCDIINIYQGYNTDGSHKKSDALDLKISDTATPGKVFAPFSGTVMRIRDTNNEMWITSNEPVEWPDGTIDYMTCLFIHADSIPVATGAKFAQGDWIYNEGNKGTDTRHVHLECAKGKFVSPYGYYNTGETYITNGETFEIWKIFNQVKVNDALFIKDSTVIKNNIESIKWRKVSSANAGTPLPDNTFFTVTADNMQFMYSCDVNDVVDFVEKGYLTKGETYHAIAQTSLDGFKWWRFRYSNGKFYWTAMIDGRYTAEEEKFDTSKVLTITTGNTLSQLYNSIDLFDKLDENESPNTKRTVIGISNKSWFGYKWFKYTFGDKIVYLPKTPDITVEEGPSDWEDLPPDYGIKALVSNVEYFNSTDVNDIAPDQYLKKDAQYTAIQRSTKVINNFKWIKIIYTDDKQYYVVDDDKIELGIKSGSGSGGGGDYSINEKGIDVSKYQGNVNWAGVKADAAGYKFGIARCVCTSTSIYVDPYFVQNIKNAQAQGFPTGAYIYTYATDTATIDQEINLAVTQLRSYKMGYPIAWDCEDNSLAAACSPDQLTTLALYALNKLKSLGFYPVLYSYTYFLTSRLVPSRIEAAGYDVWVADYRGYCGYKGKYTIWQYSSTQKVNGISGNVDCNISYHDYPAHIADLGLNGFTGGGSGTLYPSDPITGYHFVINKGNVQYFTYPSVYDEYAQYFKQGENVKITSKLKSKYDGFEFYTCYYNGETVYTAYVDDGRMSIVKDTYTEFDIPYSHTVYEETNFICEDRKGNTQVFTIPDVNDPKAEYLGRYKTARIYAKLNDTYNGFEFYAVVINNEIKYVALTEGQYVTYYGNPYERTKISENIVFNVINDGGYATPYPNKDATHFILKKGESYTPSAKLNFNYNDMEWYVISIDGIERYSPVLNNITVTAPAEEYEEIAVDSHLRISASQNSAFAYSLANTASDYVKVPIGTVLTPIAKLNKIYQEMEWYVVTIDDIKRYIPNNGQFNIYYEYSTIPCDLNYTMTVTGTMSAYDYASLNAPSTNIEGKFILISKLEESIDDKTWFTFTNNEGITKYVIYDTNNATYNYIYNSTPAPQGTYIKAISDTFKVYDHITTNDGVTIPNGSLIPISSIINEELISDIWYIGTYNENTVYCQDTADSDIVYIYDEEPVDEKLSIIIKNDKTKAYIYADKNCPGFSEIPKDTEFIPLAYIKNVSNMNWYKIEFNKTIMYLCDDENIIKKYNYESKPPIEGQYVKTSNSLDSFAYPEPSIENSKEKYLLIPDYRYNIEGILTEKVENLDWVLIKYPEYYTIDKIVYDNDPGEEAEDVNEKLVDAVDVPNTSDKNVYVPINDVTSLTYWYPNTKCTTGTVFEVLVEDSFPYYLNPIDNQQKGILQKGLYTAVAKLDNKYDGKDWYIILIDESIEVYVPLIDGQSSIYVSSEEDIKRILAEIEEEIKAIREELDSLIPETNNLTLKIQKNASRLRILELYLNELQLKYNYLFKENE